MTTSPPPDLPREPMARSVLVTDSDLVVSLVDGRTLTVPTHWFPKLSKATPALRSEWHLIGGGKGIQWPALDEDLSVAGLLRSCGPHTHR